MKELQGLLVLLLKLIFVFVFLLSNCLAENDTKILESERKALEQFRPLVNDIAVRDFEKVDSYYLKWLIAKDFRMKEAADFFRDAHNWRSKNKIDGIVNETILEFNPVPYEIGGYDKEGHPIVVFAPTFLDLRKLLVQGLREKIVRYVMQMLEKVHLQTFVASKKFNKDITKVVAILDINGYNLRQHFCLACVSVIREWFISMEKYYPELLKHFVVINVPRIAIPIVEIVKPLLSKTSANALQIFPPDRAQWSAYLLKYISPEELPYRFGGTKSDKQSK